MDGLKQPGTRRQHFFYGASWPNETAGSKEIVMPKAAKVEDLFDETHLGNEKTGALRAFIERIESVQSEVDDLKEDQKTIFDEASGAGFDKKAMRKIIAIRKKDQDVWRAEQDKIDAYLTALGLL
jgi:uncharacterized protein (UPF0335 family)